MISYYASSSEPAQVRGKTVYLQYSNRQEIVNNKTAADVAGNVLLVTIEGEDARLVSIDVLHLVSDCMCALAIYAEIVIMCGCWLFSFVIRLFFVRLWKNCWHVCKWISRPMSRQYLRWQLTSLVLWEKECMCVCLLSPSLNAASFFPILPLDSYHGCSLGCCNYFFICPSIFHIHVGILLVRCLDLDFDSAF